jgi:hypothetical protein
VPNGNAVLLNRDAPATPNDPSSNSIYNALPQLAGPTAGSALSTNGTNVGGNNSNNKRGFTFDVAYGADTSQRQLYNSSCASLVDQFVDGFNVTLFA